MPADFSDAFQAVTGNQPFPWQCDLFREFLNGPPFRRACDIPTGLGKTSLITIWLLALAHRLEAGVLAGFPRRLIYVVNRRTVVDQATREAEKLRQALEQPALNRVRKALLSLVARQTDWDGSELPPLAISTLRGGYADNAEWRDDPARPAVIIGTVDMIGSRLLFAGYGPGFKSRPLHAGFLGQDALLVHDEAHLEPAFQHLLERIEHEQERCRDFRPLRVMALSATARNGVTAEAPLLSDADRGNPVVSSRLNARKIISFHEAEAGIAAKVVECALTHQNSNQAILVFVRLIEDVNKIAQELEKKGRVQRLTGTMRGRERDQLATDDPIFARFVRDSQAEPQGTAYLICTSAGEVGIDISADHLVCDLAPFDSMAQRFGRVNRFGGKDARIDVVYARPVGGAGAKARKTPAGERYEEACGRTLALLRSLPDSDASPAALAALPAAERLAAFTPEPTILSATDILFDAWALTTVRDLPGRPPVGDWLHGLAEWEPPETHVAWREEVALIIGDLIDSYPPEDLLEDYPLKPHELLRDRHDRVFEQLKSIAERSQNLPVWILGDRDSVAVKTLKELIDEGKEALAFKTVILPPAAGGLGFRNDPRPSGLLDGKSEYREDRRECYDIADQWLDANGNPRRCRRWDDAAPGDKSMRLVQEIDTRPDDEEREAEMDAAAVSKPRFWRWYVRPRSADDDGSRTAREPQELHLHLRCAGDFADLIVAKLGLSEPEATAVRMAARWHDLGKNRRIWQRAVGNRKYPQVVLAKSGGKMHPLDLNRYRHELGSLLDIQEEPRFQALDEAARDLVMHLIAAHHGRARPHFPAAEVIDAERPYEAVMTAARKAPRRFARLQRKYGRWGLAYLESLLRAADIMASQEKLSAAALEEPEPALGGDR